MTHRFEPERAEVLESPQRRAAMPPERTLRNLGLRRGMRFADVGAGTGFFSIPAAELVGPEGHVYALDAQAAMLDKLKAKHPPPWLETIPCGEAELPLKDGSADFVFACFVLHETRDPVAFLREMGRVAVPHGPIVVLEWAKKRQPEGPPFEERLHHHGVEDLVARAGLCFRSVEFFNPSQYVVKAFKRQASGVRR